MWKRGPWTLTWRNDMDTFYPWASYQIRKIADCACAGNAWYIFPVTDIKPLVSNPYMHHDTCVKHVSWCISGSLTRGGGENVPGIPGACATRNFTYLVSGTLLASCEGTTDDRKFSTPSDNKCFGTYFLVSMNKLFNQQSSDRWVEKS